VSHFPIFPPLIYWAPKGKTTEQFGRNNCGPLNVHHLQFRDAAAYWLLGRTEVLPWTWGNEESIHKFCRQSHKGT